MNAYAQAWLILIPAINGPHRGRVLQLARLHADWFRHHGNRPASPDLVEQAILLADDVAPQHTSGAAPLPRRDGLLCPRGWPRRHEDPSGDLGQGGAAKSPAGPPGAAAGND